MTKYAPLTAHLASLSYDEWRPTFRELEDLLGFHLPNAARKHRAWWSNNGSNNVMTKAWLDAGWLTEQVDMSGEKLVFRHSRSSSSSSSPPPTSAPSTAPASAVTGRPVSMPDVSASIVGALRGTVRIVFEAPESTGETWKADVARS